MNIKKIFIKKNSSTLYLILYDKVGSPPDHEWFLVELGRGGNNENMGVVPSPSSSFYPSMQPYHPSTILE